MSDESIKAKLESLYGKVGNWPVMVHNNMITIHALQESAEDEDPLFAVVMHNPFNLRQYQVLAVLPTLDMEIAVTNSVRESVDEIVRDGVDDPNISHGIQHLMLSRLSEACAKDRDFAHKMIDVAWDESDLESAGRLYQEHYGLLSGGDFNRPLY